MLMALMQLSLVATLDRANRCGIIEFCKLQFAQHRVVTGNLPVLQWLRAQDPPCPWDESTMEFAIEEGQDHVIAWLHTQNAPVP